MIELEEFIEKLNFPYPVDKAGTTFLDIICLQITGQKMANSEIQQYKKLCAEALDHVDQITYEGLLNLRSFCLNIELVDDNMARSLIDLLTHNRQISTDRRTILLVIAAEMNYVFTEDFLNQESGVKEEQTELWLDLMMPVNWQSGLAAVQTALQAKKEFKLFSSDLIEWAKYCPPSEISSCILANYDFLTASMKERFQNWLKDKDKKVRTKIQ